MKAQLVWKQGKKDIGVVNFRDLEKTSHDPVSFVMHYYSHCYMTLYPLSSTVQEIPHHTWKKGYYCIKYIHTSTTGGHSIAMHKSLQSGNMKEDGTF